MVVSWPGSWIMIRSTPCPCGATHDTNLLRVQKFGLLLIIALVSWAIWGVATSSTIQLEMHFRVLLLTFTSTTTWNQHSLLENTENAGQEARLNGILFLKNTSRSLFPSAARSYSNTCAALSANAGLRVQFFEWNAHERYASTTTLHEPFWKSTSRLGSSHAVNRLGRTASHSEHSAQILANR